MDVEPLAPGPSPAPRDGLTMTPGQARLQTWMTDILVYVVVINLFVEYAPSVIIESFSISLLTAVLLKLMLDAILGFERLVAAWFAQREGAVWWLLGLGAIWAILFFSKFLIIEITALVFGDRVQLGGFFGIVVLILALVLARRAVSLVHDRVLGPREGPGVVSD